MLLVDLTTALRSNDEYLRVIASECVHLLGKTELVTDELIWKEQNDTVRWNLIKALNDSSSALKTETIWKLIKQDLKQSSVSPEYLNFFTLELHRLLTQPNKESRKVLESLLDSRWNKNVYYALSALERCNKLPTEIFEKRPLKSFCNRCFPVDLKLLQLSRRVPGCDPDLKERIFAKRKSQSIAATFFYDFYAVADRALSPRDIEQIQIIFRYGCEKEVSDALNILANLPHLPEEICQFLLRLSIRNLPDWASFTDVLAAFFAKYIKKYETFRKCILQALDQQGELICKNLRLYIPFFAENLKDYSELTINIYRSIFNFTNEYYINIALLCLADQGLANEFESVIFHYVANGDAHLRRSALTACKFTSNAKLLKLVQDLRLDPDPIVQLYATTLDDLHRNYIHFG